MSFKKEVKLDKSSDILFYSQKTTNDEENVKAKKRVNTMNDALFSTSNGFNEFIQSGLI